MNNYYFTFGTTHYTNDGICMAPYWVRVTARNYDRARECFIENFTSIYMESIDKFAFQYNEKNFDLSYFNKGEFCNFEAEK